MSRSKIKKIVDKTRGLTVDEKREYLRDSLKQLNGHPGFEAFLEVLDRLRESAIASAVTEDVVGNIGRTRAALGEIRAYEDIFAAVQEYISEST